MYYIKRIGGSTRTREVIYFKGIKNVRLYNMLLYKLLIHLVLSILEDRGFWVDGLRLECMRQIPISEFRLFYWHDSYHLHECMNFNSKTQKSAPEETKIIVEKQSTFPNLTVNVASLSVTEVL
jgi:hypothetical protein